MKHWQLKEHTKICSMESNNDSIWKCEHNLEQIVFYSQGDFYLITMPKCYFGENKYDDIVDILNKIGLLKTKKRIDDFNKVTDMDNDLKELRLRDIVFKDIVHEVNYIYYNNAGKKYSIMSKVNLFDAMEWRENDLIYNNAKEFKEYLISIGLEYLIAKVEELQAQNMFYNPSQKEVVKSIDSILDKIQKQINN